MLEGETVKSCSVLFYKYHYGQCTITQRVCPQDSLIGHEFIAVCEYKPCVLPIGTRASAVRHHTTELESHLGHIQMSHSPLCSSGVKHTQERMHMTYTRSHTVHSKHTGT